jgi:hypothetical protein
MCHFALFVDGFVEKVNVTGNLEHVEWLAPF